MEEVAEDWRLALLPVITEAVKTLDPVTGVTVPQLLSYPMMVVANLDYGSEEARARVKSALRLGLRTGRLAKYGRNRYGLRLLAADRGDSLCGTCGGKKKDPCAKKRRRRDPCAKKKRKRDPCAKKKRDPCAKKKKRKKSCISRCK